MNFRRRRRDEVGVDLTPLIDVVFLLLIFFMVSTTFIRETQLEIDLPEAGGELQEIEEDLIEITIDRRGDYSVNDHVLVNRELDTLMRGLRTALADRDHTTRVVITADASAEHQAVVRAMDAAGRVGLTRVSITTRQPEAQE